MDEWIERTRELLPSDWASIAAAALAAGVAVAVALVAHRILFRILRRVARASESDADNIVVRELVRPTRWAIVALGLVLAARAMPVLDTVWQAIAGFILPALIGWMALSIMRATVKALELRADISVADNLAARRRRTRLAIFSRIGTFAIIFVTVGLMLLSIPGIRDIGVTLMASAGLAALAVGAAAQPALKALIGGLQMALTEPIRIDDVVIIDGEWGRIEDIRTTYVVVRIWDDRRLVVPVHKFLDESFQNWTRRESQLLGTVFLHLDPMAEVEKVRAKYEELIAQNPLWDRRVQVVQVTGTAPDYIEVRLLMSAKDAGTAFDLRCQIREAMMAFIRDEMPEAIARRRWEPIEKDDGGDTLPG
ncbi:mechanosensitive ion channel family protein [Erythrobacter sp.]|jgi:small-conductance mechanosensitive channel|uniref:mechanosensitive ion channel family protein n=1 Tax=Erythrobacter sp. TaxID=1042 RepID=UPI002E9867AF|nr:mechanosensitive ion channel family protein [Erythrobacter sp.]